MNPCRRLLANIRVELFVVQLQFQPMTIMSKKPTDEELFAQFEGIGEDAAPSKASSKPTSKPPTSNKPSQDPDDLFQELGIPERPKPTSRPHTPKMPSTSATPALRSSPKRNSTATPPSSDAARTSEERALPRKSGESTRSFHNSFTPKTENEAELEHEPEKSSTITPAATQAQSSGGGWWGGIFATASAAVKQAEALAKEIQRNEEAQRWAEQVKGNVGALRGLGAISYCFSSVCGLHFITTLSITDTFGTGGELRSRALPTFTSLLHTLAPPISSHERLQIHLTHDILGYPSLDPLIYSTFSRVMSQVEGGDLMVIQRGHESAPRRSSSDGGHNNASSTSGWSDGPWWRQAGETRHIGAVKGLVEGSKLARVSAESYAQEYYAAHGGLEEAAKQATETLSESNPVRSSDIFLAFQAVTHTASEDLFGSSTASGKKEGEAEVVVQPPSGGAEELICFAIYLHDPVHGITYSTLTQSVPAKWIEWVDASAISTGETHLPEEIADIVDSGGVDPREWVAEWVEEALSLGVGVIAQRYVARRMGVGLGGLGRGKARQEAIENRAGEAARVV